MASCCRDQSFDRTRSPSIRSLGSCPFFGKSSTLSRTGWPSEIISRGGSKIEATLALVTASKMSKKRNSSKRPILMMKERAGRRMCADDGGQEAQRQDGVAVGTSFCWRPISFRDPAPLLSGTVRLYHPLNPDLTHDKPGALCLAYRARSTSSWIAERLPQYRSEPLIE